MRIRLDKIEDQPFRWSETESVAAESMERPDLLELTDVEWSGSVAASPPGYRLLAALRYDQKLACGRCLKPYDVKVESEIDLVIMVNPPEPTTGEVQLEESDLGVLTLASEELDTDPILREQLELNIPMSTLCRPNCAGLCPHCGADRNEAPDCCDGRDIDPRWQALGDLELS
jgi:uncharacterized protein